MMSQVQLQVLLTPSEVSYFNILIILESGSLGVADTIRSFLHFSVPDEGPLTDFESWMPDFMSGLAKGIQKTKS